jgi:hypothetical protein
VKLFTYQGNQIVAGAHLKLLDESRSFQSWHLLGFI